MKIGIIGTPKSGKTALAKFIQKEFPEYKIIDRYVEKFSKRTNSGIGVTATHYVNAAIAIERINAEFAAEENFITCGTIIETMAYNAAYALPTINEVTERHRVTIMMQWLGLITSDTFLYDRLFYLPAQLEEWMNLDYQVLYASKLFRLKPVQIDDRDYSEVIQPLKDYEATLNESSPNEQ